MENLMLMLILYPLGFALLVGGVLALLKQEVPHRRLEGFESWITAKWDAIVAQRRCTTWYFFYSLAFGSGKKPMPGPGPSFTAACAMAAG